MTRAYADSGSRRRLAARLKLRWSPVMQDWEVEVADPGRLSEFVAALSEFDQEGELVSLFELILASLDDGLVAGIVYGPAQMVQCKFAIRRLGQRFPGVRDYWLSASLPVSMVLVELDEATSNDGTHPIIPT